MTKPFLGYEFPFPFAFPFAFAFPFRFAFAFAFALVFASAGCLAPQVATPVPTTTQDTPIRIRQNQQNKVDILFMIDNSPSMAAMQSELRARFGDFFQVFDDLANSGVYADLHIGVVTSDYGAGAVAVSGGCQASPGGQKGRLQPVGQAAAASCAGPVGAPYVQYAFNAAGATSNLPPGQDLLSTFTCMASVGVSGCGFEHQLESVYAALHDDNFNTGFLRDDAPLAVVFVTNEDDSSAPTTAQIYDPAQSGSYGYYDTYRQTRYGVACGVPLMLTPYGPSLGPLSDCQPAPNLGPMDIGMEYDVSRYVDYFTKPRSEGGLKANPDDVILVAIDAPESPVEIILADSSSGTGLPPRPAYAICSTLDPPGCLVRLQHSCQNQVEPAFFGDPGVRLNAVVKRATLHQVTSICGDGPAQTPDYTAALQSVGKLISKRIGDGCIPAMLADVDHANCAVEDVTTDAVTGSASISEVPRCDLQPNVYPCWSIQVKTECATLSPQSVGLTIDYNGGTVPDNTVARVECATLALPAGR